MLFRSVFLGELADGDKLHLKVATNGFGGQEAIGQFGKGVASWPVPVACPVGQPFVEESEFCSLGEMEGFTAPGKVLAR